MIRTNTVNLTVIPAIAFRQKLPSGGSGITILRYGVDQPGIASISKTSGEPIYAKNISEKLYPPEAFTEAMELTKGMPYGKRKPVRVTEEIKPAEIAEEKAEELPEEVVVDSADYQKIVDKYTDKNGKLSYELMNKDFIKAGKNNPVVLRKLEENAPLGNIRFVIVKDQFNRITGNPNLTNKQINKMAELLDEVSPKSVFKELNLEIRKWKKARKG
ncbi:MAG: hypothetical protein IIZ48_01155 [Erysipelotrichales bacterium]|nr:hypothetical protein [Erysipelotrichales bacterium]